MQVYRCEGGLDANSVGSLHQREMEVQAVATLARVGMGCLPMGGVTNGNGGFRSAVGDLRYQSSVAGGAGAGMLREACWRFA